MTPAYRRILLKLSGEALMGTQSHGIDPAVASFISQEIRRIHAQGVQVAIVIGGGNFYRGGESRLSAVDRVTGDSIGMLATMINSLALGKFLEQASVPARVYAAAEMPAVAPLFVRNRVVEDLELGRTVIIGGGTGNPFFTTDTAAALRCAELQCQVLLKATKVDGVYDSDPAKNPRAHKYQTVTHAEALSQNLKIMDAAAFSLCMENGIPIIVFKLMEEGNLYRSVIEGQPVGSIIERGV